MELIIKYNNPRELYMAGYKTYFFSHYIKELVISIIFLIISIYIIFFSSIPNLGYFLFSFCALYLFALWLFYYSGPLNAISKRKAKNVTVIINGNFIGTTSDHKETKYNWEAIGKVYTHKDYIYILTKDNRFIILRLKDMKQDEIEWLICYCKDKNLLV